MKIKVYTSAKGKTIAQSSKYRVIVDPNAVRNAVLVFGEVEGLHVFGTAHAGQRFGYVVEGFMKKLKNDTVALNIIVFYLHHLFTSVDDFNEFIKDPQVLEIEQQILQLKERWKDFDYLYGMEAFITNYKRPTKFVMQSYDKPKGLRTNIELANKTVKKEDKTMADAGYVLELGKHGNATSVTVELDSGETITVATIHHSTVSGWKPGDYVVAHHGGPVFKGVPTLYDGSFKKREVPNRLGN